MNIYTDKSYLPENVLHATLLYPFWGFQSVFRDGMLGRRRFEHYLENGAELFQLSGLRESRIAVLPFQWEQIIDFHKFQTVQGLEARPADLARAVRLAEEFAALAASGGKPVAVFFCHDSIAKVPLDNSVVFRTSMQASARRPNEYAMPFWMTDPVEEICHGELPLREKSARPVIGFCGHNPVRMDARSKFKRRLGAIPGLPRCASLLGIDLLTDRPYRTRAEALNVVSRSRVVRSNFIFRDTWFNGVFEDGQVNRALLLRSREQYVENMFGSDYVLCTRGNGNYSIRFYEALCSGRIPVFVNTDCVLPFEEWIDWKQYCVWVEGRDVARVAEIIAEFHEGLSAGEFKDRQRACRQLWVEWLSPFGFFKSFRRYFDFS
jgi:hypothetical protein